MKHYDQVFLGVRLSEEDFKTGNYQDLVHDLLDPEATQPSGVSPVQDVSAEDRQAEFEAFTRQVKGLAADVNQSVGAAQDSDDAAVRKGQLETALAKIAELQALATRHPALKLERVQEVTSLIENIDRETRRT
jgi:hypothetical protein